MFIDSYPLETVVCKYDTASGVTFDQRQFTINFPACLPAGRQ